MNTSLKKATPLLKWIISGGLAVLVDLSVLYMLVELIHLHYLLAASIAFIISASFNYTISKLTIFRNPQNSTARSYTTFMSISLIGLVTINICMYIFVEILLIHYLISRFLLAGTLGVSSFFLHKYFSFKDFKKISSKT